MRYINIFVLSLLLLFITAQSISTLSSGLKPVPSLPSSVPTAGTVRTTSSGISFSNGSSWITAVPSTGLGTTTTPTFAGLTTTGAQTVSVQSASDFSLGLVLQKRGTTGDANAAVAGGGEIGYNYWKAWNGSSYQPTALISNTAYGTQSGSNAGSRLIFYNAAFNSTTLTNRLMLDENGSVNFHNGTTTITTTGMITQTGVAFASLGTPANGTMVYCTNCTIANPCASGGTGALAKRLNSTWVCN